MIKKIYADGSAINDLDQTRPLVCRVAKQMGDRVGNTLGPGGRNYMTMQGITNDGVSILQEIRFEDEREDAIADAFEEVARRQDLDAGDGTTTATVFATSLTPLVLQDVPPIETPLGKSVMEIKKELEDELTQAIELLKTHQRPTLTLADLEKVAKTAMEGHPSSTLIANTVYEVGYQSNIALEEGFNEQITSTTTPGVHYPLKIETPAMFTNIARKEAEHQDTLVLVVNHVFEAYSDLSGFFTTMIAHKKATGEKPQPIVIIGKQFSIPFTSQVVGVTKQLGLPILLLSAQALKDEEFIDLAEFVGANYIDTHPKTGIKASSITYKDAGRAKKIIASPKQTAIMGGAGIESGRVSLRVAELNKLAETEQLPITREELKRRAAGLQGGVATIYVDAKTAVDRYYLKKKVEDAVNSCKSALEHGTVPGGGLAYLKVAEALPDGGYLKQILPVIHERVQRNAGGNLIIDEEEVRDAYYTDKSALENAVAVVKILVTMEGVIVDKEPDPYKDLVKALNG